MILAGRLSLRCQTAMPRRALVTSGQNQPARPCVEAGSVWGSGGGLRLGPRRACRCRRAQIRGDRDSLAAYVRPVRSQHAVCRGGGHWRADADQQDRMPPRQRGPAHPRCQARGCVHLFFRRAPRRPRLTARWSRRYGDAARRAGDRATTSRRTERSSREGPARLNCSAPSRASRGRARVGTQALIPHEAIARRAEHGWSRPCPAARVTVPRPGGARPTQLASRVCGHLRRAVCWLQRWWPARAAQLAPMLSWRRSRRSGRRRSGLRDRVVDGAG